MVLKKELKKLNIAKEDNIYDSDPHVYMSLADINETNHDEDSSLPSDSVPVIGRIYIVSS